MDLISIGNLSQIISALLFFLISCVYGFLKKLRKNFHCKLLISYLVSLLVFDVLFIIFKVTKCIVPLTYITLYSLLSSLAWLNLMSINVWTTLRKMRTVVHEESNYVLYLKYSIYGWGIPAIFTGTAIVADFAKFSELRPGFDESCSFSGHNHAEYYYVIIPFALVMITNSIIFVMTAWRCARTKAEVLKLSEEHKTKFMFFVEQLLLSVKLFVLMGVGWSTILIGALFPLLDMDMEIIMGTTNLIHALALSAILFPKAFRLVIKNC